MRAMRQAVTVAGLLLLVAGCTSWRRTEVPAPPATLRTHRGPLRVTVTSSEMFQLVNVVMVTDSLFGTTDDLSAIRIGIPLREVTRIEERFSDRRRTALAVAGIVAFVLVSGIAGF
jgi:hypothetical protein